MKTKKIHFRSSSRAVALEPRLLFDGAGAVAAVDGMDDFDFDEQLNDGLVEDVHEAGSEQQNIVNDGNAIEIIDGDDSLHIPSSLGSRLGLDAEQENILAGTEEKNLLIIDSRVDNHELLLESVGSSVTVVVVGEGESGLDAISNALAGSNGYDAIHIISHGTPGSFTLGTDQVDSTTIQHNSAQLQGWAEHLNAGADILLYGCDVAQGETGQSFIEQLAAITGADIAASINPTGNAEHGGDWVLESETGPIEAGVLAMYGYEGLLADASFKDTQPANSPREVMEDGSFTLSNFTVSGADSLTVTITLSENGKTPASGKFSLSTKNGLTFTTGNGSSATTMTFSGTATDINNALASLKYDPTANFNGEAKLAVVSGSSNKDIVINVIPDNDAPSFAPPLVGHADVARADEEGSGKLVVLTPKNFGIDATNTTTLGLFDPDLDPALSTVTHQTAEQIVFEVKDTPANGRLVFGAGNTPLLAGSLFSLQDLIDGKVKYQHDDSKEAREGITADSEKDSFNLTVRDGAGGEVDGTVHIKINPVNDAPSIGGSVSGGVIAYEGRNGVPISITVTDPDQLNDNWTFTFGNLTLPGDGTVLYLDNDGDGKFSAGDTQITNGSTFTGSQADLSNKLKVDISDDEPTTPISFDITVTDDGGGTATPKTATSTITIEPRENNDHPELSTNAAPDLDSAHYAGDNNHIISGNDLNTLLGITDADSPNDTLTYTLTSAGFIAESGSTGTVYLLNKDGKYMGSGSSFTQAELDAGDISIVFTGGGKNTSHITFTVRDGELTAFSTVKQTEWTPSAIEGGTRDSTDDNYLTHSFYVRFNTATGDGGSYTLEPANQAPVVGTIVGIPASALKEGQSTLLYGGDAVQNGGKPGIVITDNDNADSEITIRLEKVPTGGHIELKIGENWQTVPIFGSFTYAQLNNGQVRYVHDGGEQFLSSNLGFAFSVSDGSAAVTPDFDSDHNNFTVEATPVNDTPEVSISGNPMVLEGDTLIFNTSGNPAITLSDVDGSGDAAPGSLDNWANSTVSGDELYVTVNFTSGEGAGHLNGTLYNGTTVIEDGDTVLKSDIDNGKLKYVHDGSENHSGKFTLTVNDAQNKTSDGTHATSVGNTLEVNIEVAPVNDTPIIDQWTNNDDTGRDARPTDEVNGQQAYNTGLQVYEGGSGVIAGKNESVSGAGSSFVKNTDGKTVSQLVAIDPDNSDTQIQYKILTNTTHGKLTLNGKTLGVGSTFTQADLNNGLVKYTHDASESAGEGIITDTFQFQVGDSGPGTYPRGWFDIEILPANDRPTVEAPSSQPIIVDTSSGNGVPITGTGNKPFSVDDVDSVGGAGTKDFLQVTVRLLANDGTPFTDYTNVNFGYATGSGVTVTQDGSAKILQFQGSKTQVNDALAGLTVKFADDRNARYQIEVIVDDRARNGDGSLNTSEFANGGKYNEPTTPGGPSGNISTTEFDWATNIKVPTSTSADGYGNINSSTVEIWASNKNDAPVVTVPGSAVVVHEDVRTQISGITYDDPDAFDSTNNTLTLSVSNGTLWFSANESDKSVPGGATVSSGEVGSNTVTLKGSKAQLDAALAQLRYQGDLDFNGTDQLEVTVNDGGNYGQDNTSTEDGASDTKTVAIHILPVNDAPTLTLPNENSYLRVTGGSFVLSDSSNPIVIADDKDFSNSGKTNQQDGVDNFTVTLTLSGTGTKLALRI